MAAFRPAERPVILQLFGTRPEAFAASIRIMEERQPPDGYDLNFGCPAPKIVKNGGGSALLKNPERISQIAPAAVAESPRPVLAKIRSGWEVGSENALDVARLLEECGVAAIAVHGRTRSQMFSGRADWEIISRIRGLVRIPVIGNGDITSGEDARRMIRQTGCQLVMVGRAALGNPWVFSRINAVLEGGGADGDPESGCREPDWPERLRVIREHLAMAVADKGEVRGVREMRKHLGWYVKGFEGAPALRQRLMHAETEGEVMGLLQEPPGW
jgi:tRNA-dihydrouridine synthase B